LGKPPAIPIILNANSGSVEIAADFDIGAKSVGRPSVGQETIEHCNPKI
jgi:hypothetical protein